MQCRMVYKSGRGKLAPKNNALGEAVLVVASCPSTRVYVATLLLHMHTCIIDGGVVGGRRRHDQHRPEASTHRLDSNASLRSVVPSTPSLSIESLTVAFVALYRSTKALCMPRME